MRAASRERLGRRDQIAGEAMGRAEAVGHMDEGELPLASNIAVRVGQAVSLFCPMYIVHLLPPQTLLPSKVAKQFRNSTRRVTPSWCDLHSYVPRRSARARRRSGPLKKVTLVLAFLSSTHHFSSSSKLAKLPLAIQAKRNWRGQPTKLLFAACVDGAARWPPCQHRSSTLRPSLAMRPSSAFASQI